MSKRFRVNITGTVDSMKDPTVALHDMIGDCSVPWLDANVDVKHTYKSPAKKGSAFEREFCKKLSLWVSKGVDDNIYWRTAGSGARATVKKSADQVGDITCFPEKVEVGGWLMDIMVFELKNKNLMIGSIFKEPFKVLTELLQKCIEVQLARCPIVIMKSEGTLVTITAPQVVQGLIDNFFILNQGTAALFDFREILNLDVDFVKKTWIHNMGILP